MGCEKSLPLTQPYQNTESPNKIQPIDSKVFKRSATNRTVTSNLGLISDHFKVLKAIGTNRLGTMLYAQDLQTGTYRAIREVSKNLLRDNPKSYQEIEILKDFDHPNIIKAFQTIETSINYYNVFEYLNGVSLKEKVKRNGNEIALSKYVHEIIGGINYMHLQKVMHCNLNPSNILFSEGVDESVPKIIGFNFAQRLDDMYPIDLKNLSYLYVSPEILKKKFNEKTDMWSLGIIVYEILVGKHPYISKDKHDIIKEIYRGELDYENPNFIGLSFNAQDFIKKLLNANPDERLSAKEALNHPWLSLSAKENILNYEAMMKLRNFKIKSNISREMLKYIESKIDLKDHDIIGVFKSIDYDSDGFVSKDEVVEAFRLVGIDASAEINVIMNNVDIDMSGALDFTEIKIALTDWDKQIKKKILSKIFKNEEGQISIQLLRHQFNEILPHEWNDFIKKTKSDGGQVSVAKLKEYIMGSLDL